MNITHHLIRKVIVALILVFFVDLSVQQSWAKPVSRGPSSVEVDDENYENTDDEVEPLTGSQPAPPKSETEEPEKQGLRNLVTSAELTIRTKQSFEKAVIELMSDGDSEIYDAGQPLTREFDNAFVARERINRCSRFILSDGNNGEWGRLIDASFTRYAPLRSALLSNAAGSAAGMRSVCPRFTNLTQEERRDFWVWVMASLALYESTCGFDTTNSNNSNAVGIYQLHRSTADRLPRSLIANQRCGRLTGAEIARPEENILCTLDFIRDGFSGRMDHAPAGLITRAQQFQKLRTENTPLVRLIKKFQLCLPASRRPLS